MTVLTIGQVAEATGLSVHAIRFYEKEGLLLDVAARSGSGHRQFSPDTVQWLHMCQTLRQTGMPVAQLRTLAALIRQGPGNEVERLQFLVSHQERLREQLAHINDALAIVSAKIETYQGMLSDSRPPYPLWPQT